MRFCYAIAVLDAVRRMQPWYARAMHTINDASFTAGTNAEPLTGCRGFLFIQRSAECAGRLSILQVAYDALQA
jgi:hypothetical protein